MVIGTNKLDYWRFVHVGEGVDWCGEREVRCRRISTATCSVTIYVSESEFGDC